MQATGIRTSFSIVFVIIFLSVKCDKDDSNIPASQAQPPNPCSMADRMVHCIVSSPKNGAFFPSGPVSLNLMVTAKSPIYEIFLGNHPDSLKLISRQSGNKLELTQLESPKTYYWKFNGSGLCGGCITGIMNFTVVPDTNLPYVVTDAIPDGQSLPITLSGTVLSAGSSTLKEKGFWFGRLPKPQSGGNKISLGQGTGFYAINLDSIKESTTYFFTAFATNSSGTFFGNEVSFKTGTLIIPDSVNDIEGNRYASVVIGNQVWMKENLKTTKFNDGTAINLVKDNTEWSNLEPKFTWFENDSANSKKYGAIYNGFVVTSGKICPTGWHVPSEDEWKSLEYFLGMSVYDALKTDMRGSYEGIRLKSETGWHNDGNGLNTTGFTGLPGGYRHPLGTFSYPGIMGRWWSSTKDPKYNVLWSRSLWYDAKGISRTLSSMQNGCSIRCLKD